MRAGRHLRANVVGYLALAVALGGTSYAAISLPAKSVGAKELKPNAVNSKKVRNRSLKAVDFRRGQLPPGEVGLRGPQGPGGAPGLDGLQGPPGPTFAAETDGANNPSTSPDGPALSTLTFTPPSAGKLLVRSFQPDTDVNCSTGSGFAGLYLDGARIPGTYTRMDGLTGAELAGIVEVTAGQHAVSAIGDCPSGDHTGTNSASERTLSVLLLGG